jgi:hypothetical protein
VLSLFPVVRLMENLKDTSPGRDRDEQPVDRAQKGPFHVGIVTSSDSSPYVRHGEGEIAQKQRKCADQEHGWWEESGDDRRMREIPENRHDPVDRIDEWNGHSPGEEEVEGDEGPSPDRPVCPHGMPRVNEIGVEISLDPPTALPDPVVDTAAGLLVGCRVQNCRPPAVLVQAQAEVSVLGDVVGVPSAQLSQSVCDEEVRGSSERGWGHPGSAVPVGEGRTTWSTQR